MIVTIIRLGQLGGLRSVVAESVLLRQQILILNRGRKRAPNLRSFDRIIVGLCTLFMRPARVLRSAIALKTSTLLHFHKMLTKHKYRLLSLDLFRCESAILRTYWVVVVMDQFTRRIVGFAVHRGVVDGVALCRMVNRAVRMQTLPKYLSSDHDPLYRFHQWQANLRVLEVKEIKTVRYIPLSHPFVERLIGTIRREYLDQTLFWTAGDLEEKLRVFQHYFNRHRAHSGLKGRLPEPAESRPTIIFASYKWQRHCRGLYQTPIAA